MRGRRASADDGQPRDIAHPVRVMRAASCGATLALSPRPAKRARMTYLIVQHDGIAERNMDRAHATERQCDDHVRSVAASQIAASEVENAAELGDPGTITAVGSGALKPTAPAAH
jgi:hypothetical protein